MKKISLGFIVLTMILTITPSVSALTPLGREIKETIKETIKEGKNEGSNPAAIRKEIKKDVKEIRMGLLDKVNNFMKKNLRFEARVKGKITVIGSNNFSLTTRSSSYTGINDCRVKTYSPFCKKLDFL